jgi:hypothetical protein
MKKLSEMTILERKKYYEELRITHEYGISSIALTIATISQIPEFDQKFLINMKIDDNFAKQIYNLAKKNEQKISNFSKFVQVNCNVPVDSISMINEIILNDSSFCSFVVSNDYKSLYDKFDKIGVKGEKKFFAFLSSIDPEFNVKDYNKERGITD